MCISFGNTRSFKLLVKRCSVFHHLVLRGERYSAGQDRCDPLALKLKHRKGSDLRHQVKPNNEVVCKSNQSIHKSKLETLLRLLTCHGKPINESPGASAGGNTCLYNGPTRLSSTVTSPFVSRNGK